MTPQDFFTYVIEDCIFGDLESMSKIQIEDMDDVMQDWNKNTYGLASYPMIMTIISGMELLGRLLLPQSAKSSSHTDNFVNYWENYFAVEYPKYSGLGNFFYKMVRHGIAHHFLVKHGVAVSKSYGEAITLAEKDLFIDPTELYLEFKQSYINQVKPLVEGGLQDRKTTIESIQDRIVTLAKEYDASTSRLFESLPPSTINALHVRPVDGPHSTSTTTTQTTRYPGYNDESLLNNLIESGELTDAKKFSKLLKNRLTERELSAYNWSNDFIKTEEYKNLFNYTMFAKQFEKDEELYESDIAKKFHIHEPTIPRYPISEIINAYSKALLIAEEINFTSIIDPIKITIINWEHLSNTWNDSDNTHD